MPILATVEKDVEEVNEQIQLEARDLMNDVIKASGMSKSAISKAAHRSRPQLQMMMSNMRNLNLRTLSHFMHAAGFELQIAAVPRRDLVLEHKLLLEQKSLLDEERESGEDTVYELDEYYEKLSSRLAELDNIMSVDRFE